MQGEEGELMEENENESMNECIPQWLAPPPWLGLWGLGETCGHRRMAPQREGQRQGSGRIPPTTKTPCRLHHSGEDFLFFLLPVRELRDGLFLSCLGPSLGSSGASRWAAETYWGFTIRAIRRPPG